MDGAHERPAVDAEGDAEAAIDLDGVAAGAPGRGVGAEAVASFFRVCGAGDAVAR